jgi:hypothetical protein
MNLRIGACREGCCCCDCCCWPVLSAVVLAADADRVRAVAGEVTPGQGVAPAVKRRQGGDPLSQRAYTSTRLTLFRNSKAWGSERQC